MSSFDCNLFIETIVPELYGYKLDKNPECCNNETIFCDTNGPANGSSRIIKLVYSNYNLGGYLSERIASLTALEGLYLDRNQLRGPIPTTLNNLLNLQWLHLENNQFSGEIPDLSNCKDLTDVFLQNNELIGTVPVSFGRLPKLTQLFLQNNTLTGDLPFKSSVPNSTYQFAPQRNPPAVSPGQAQGLANFNPIILPALLSSVGLLVVVFGVFWAFRRHNRRQDQETPREDIAIYNPRDSVGSDLTRGSSDDGAFKRNSQENGVDPNPEIIVLSKDPVSVDIQQHS